MSSGSYVVVRTVRVSSDKWRERDGKKYPVTLIKADGSRVVLSTTKPKAKRSRKARTVKRSEVRAVQMIAKDSGESLAREIALAERKARFEESLRADWSRKVGEYL